MQMPPAGHIPDGFFPSPLPLALFIALKPWTTRTTMTPVIHWEHSASSKNSICPML